MNVYNAHLYKIKLSEVRSDAFYLFHLYVPQMEHEFDFF